MEKDNIDLPKDFLKQFKNKEEFQNFFQTLFKQGVEEILKAELDEHLGYEKHSPEGHHSGNSRNGFSKKKVKTESVGDMILNIPRDRKSTFKPQLSPKHERMSDTIEQAIIGMYSRGMTTRDIEEQVREMYGIDVREGTISNVTNRLIDNIKQWQIRPLELVYFVVWMDGISLKIRSNGNIINKTIFLVIGLNNQGMKEVLGMWINETESASFWLNVLTDLKARGVEDILIACTDNLKGFTDAIRSIFPKTITQLCVVHQIRNSARYVVWKDKKEFMIDLKAVYDAPNREAAADALNALESKWGKKYGYVVQSWRNNWDDLTHYFDFPHEVRRIIYTTNVIESLNSGIRKYTLLKNIFPDDSAALKAVYLAINNLEKKWVHTVRNWGAILNQFIIIFEGRCQH
ncbi:MAG: IS256 family transposase [Bacteroidia bacterium]|nr:IS256 family transposase [Bacteroidota bacterium]MBP9082605.1 IS256 family transposase [Bacteroidia bacterium]MBK7388773.1 IS256 family transposase [Bacteroidota bacterium]MBK8873443.1 IS256 family transposase [Bacteroidota bacterium]MBK9047817.1 IS256 family transposase [Bacteroidota bacterium]